MFSYTTGALVHGIFMDLLVLFSFLQALRTNPLMSLWGAYLSPAASYFLFPIVK